MGIFPLNDLLIFLALVFFLGGIVLTVVVKKKDGKRTATPLFLGIFFAVVALGISAVVIIPTGYTGVRTRFGQISQNVVPTGVNFKIPLIENIEIVSNKKEDLTLADMVWGESSDKVQVYGSQFVVTYRINPEYAAYLYSTVANYRRDLINASMLASAFKDASASLTSKEVTIRNKVEPMTAICLQAKADEKYGKDVILINQVIINDMNFEDSYNEAIARKNQAEMEYEQAQVVNRTNIERATAEKKVAETNAQAAAAGVTIAAEAQAKATVIAANAEAEANRIVAESITPMLLQKMEMEARMRHGWVTVITGSAITDVTDVQ